MKNVCKVRYLLLIVIISSLILIIGCNKNDLSLNIQKKSENIPKEIIEKNNSENVIFDFNQEIYGRVRLHQGDCMPCVGNKCNGCKTSYPSRKIYIREPVILKYPEEMNTKKFKLIKVIKADENGFFHTRLPLGEYSIFVEDNSEEYCNRFKKPNEFRYFCPMTVEEGTNNIGFLDIDHATW